MRRLGLWLDWLDLSTYLNPSQVVRVHPKPVKVTLEKVQPMQKRGRNASALHPDSFLMQERGQQHAASSHSDHLEIGPDLPGSVQCNFQN